MSALIEPVRKGRDLANEIESARPEAGSLVVWWLGQSGFVVKSRFGTLVVDPYLSEHLTLKYAGTEKPHVRMTAAPFGPTDLSGVDLFLSSHKHSDHLDPGSLPDLMRCSPTAMLGLPAAIVEHAAGLGLPRERLWGLVDDQTCTFADFTIRPLPAAHEGLDTDDLGRHLYLGFVIEADGLKLYHSGDCVLYPELPRRLNAAGPIDAMFLPINGRDPKRGVAGNMSAAEAVELACLCRPRYIVPHHYDMFTFNTVPVSEFERQAAALPAGTTARVLKCGERWEIAK
jgi:L-ascorbate 6-phosphate lactonase